MSTAKATLVRNTLETKISMSVSFDEEKKGLSEDSKPENVQTAGSSLATMQVKLILDLHP